MPITPPHQTPDAASSIVDNQQAPLAGNPRAHVEVGVLGPLRVVGQWGPIPLPAAKPRAVLTALALRPGTSVSVAGLIAALWGQDPPRTAEKLVQGYVSRLRRALPAGTITTVAGGYVLALEPHQVDAERFEALVDGARRPGPQTGISMTRPGLLREALHLWRGRPLVDLTDQPFGMAEAARLEELRRGAEEDLADARLAVGEHRDAVAGLEAAVADEPLRERRWGQLMLAMYRSGRQADSAAHLSASASQVGRGVGHPAQYRAPSARRSHPAPETRTRLAPAAQTRRPRRRAYCGYVVARCWLPGCVVGDHHVLVHRHRGLG